MDGPQIKNGLYMVIQHILCVFGNAPPLIHFLMLLVQKMKEEKHPGAQGLRGAGFTGRWT